MPESENWDCFFGQLSSILTKSYAGCAVSAVSEFPLSAESTSFIKFIEFAPRTSEPEGSVLLANLHLAKLPIAGVAKRATAIKASISNQTELVSLCQFVAHGTKGHREGPHDSRVATTNGLTGMQGNLEAQLKLNRMDVYNRL